MTYICQADLKLRLCFCRIFFISRIKIVFKGGFYAKKKASENNDSESLIFILLENIPRKDTFVKEPQQKKCQYQKEDFAHSLGGFARDIEPIKAAFAKAFAPQHRVELLVFDEVFFNYNLSAFKKH